MVLSIHLAINWEWNQNAKSNYTLDKYLICDIFYIITTRAELLAKGGCMRTLLDIQKRYKMYKNTITYKNAMELEVEVGNNEDYEIDSIWNNTVFTEELEAGRDLLFQCRE